MLATFIDGLLGHAVGAAAKRPGVTIHLSLDYLAMARAGEWVEGEARVTRLTKDVAFAEARAFVGARDVIRASAIFKLMERKRA
jgi:acyl-coenzyme A thioesterase PaaI-like protein